MPETQYPSHLVPYAPLHEAPLQAQAAPTEMRFDGTWAGLLSCVFVVYERRMAQARLLRPGATGQSLFDAPLHIATDEARAQRVWRGLQSLVRPDVAQDIFRCFLSEATGADDLLLRAMRKLFDSQGRWQDNYTDPDILAVAKLGRKVWREKHRFEAFVRFNALADGSYYAAFSPDHDVLPLIVPHFARRYADMEWVLYDLRRRYGVHRGLDGALQEVTVDFSVTPLGEGLSEGAVEDIATSPQAALAAALQADEQAYQQLWMAYYESVNIPARRNTKLHLKHVPRRYWQYLTEKQLPPREGARAPLPAGPSKRAHGGQAG